jgi:hypothetical protein
MLLRDRKVLACRRSFRYFPPGLFAPLIFVVTTAIQSQHKQEISSSPRHSSSWILPRASSSQQDEGKQSSCPDCKILHYATLKHASDNLQSDDAPCIRCPRTKQVAAPTMLHMHKKTDRFVRILTLRGGGGMIPGKGRKHGKKGRRRARHRPYESDEEQKEDDKADVSDSSDSDENWDRAGKDDDLRESSSVEDDVMDDGDEDDEGRAAGPKMLGNCVCVCVCVCCVCVLCCAVLCCAVCM